MHGASQPPNVCTARLNAGIGSGAVAAALCLWRAKGAKGYRLSEPDRLPTTSERPPHSVVDGRRHG